MVDWSGFVELVRSRQRFLLTSHVRPDCDCLGSELAMLHILQSLGKDAMIVNGFAVPPHLQFLDQPKRCNQLGINVAADQLADREVILILDTSAWVQLGTMAEVIRASRAVKAVIDHHVSQDDLDARLFKSTEAEATGRLVLEAADALGAPLSPQMALPLFAAVATDTGWFRFASTEPGTLRIAARLMEAGVKPDWLYKQLYEQDTLPRLRLIGNTLARADRPGRAAHLHMDRGGRFRRRRGDRLGQRGRDQHDADGRRDRGGGDPGRTAKRRIQSQLPQSLRSRLLRGGRTIWRRRPQAGGRRDVEGALGVRPGEGP